MTLASSLQLSNSEAPRLHEAGTQSTSRSSASCLAFVLLLVSNEGIGDDRLGYERRAWNTVLLRRPRPEIRDLTTLGTEWSPGVGVPSRGLEAQRAVHE